jgi:hypothetical protein
MQAAAVVGACAILLGVWGRAMTETRKIAAILVADSRLAGAAQNRTLSVYGG